jgi:hypothetical protein
MTFAILFVCTSELNLPTSEAAFNSWKSTSQAVSSVRMLKRSSRGISVLIALIGFGTWHLET